MANRTVNVTINYQVNVADVEKAKAASQRAQQATDNLRKSTNQLSNDVKKAGDDGSKAFNSINTAIKAISFVAIAKQVLDFTKNVISVRGEFQKFEAVLTNTLGSRSAALIALGRINEFAKSTPYSVSELTESFIKLANRGVQPTIKEMKAIADLSATLGKDFSQVVEAILDINNPERWKEIGIKAETAGDKVRLSFRGVTQEVDRTVEGVTQAVTALGQLNGVAGSTDAISRTLVGQVSNLSDAWDQLLNTIGKGNEGILFNAVSLLSQAIEKANELLKSNAQEFEELEAKTLAAEVEGFENLAKAFNDVDKAREVFARKTEDRLSEIRNRFKEVRDSMEKTSLFNITGDQAGIVQRNKLREEELEKLRRLEDIYSDSLPKAIEEATIKLKSHTEVEEKELGIIQELENRIKDLQEQIKTTTNANDLGPSGNLIIKLKLAQEELEKLLGKTKNKTKKDANEVQEYLAYLSDLELFQTKEVLKNKQQQREDDAKHEAELYEDMFNTYMDFLKKREDAEKEHEEKKKRREENIKAIRVAAIEITSEQLQSVEYAELNSLQNRLQNLRDYYDQQYLLAGDNKKARDELRIREERESADLRKKIALKEWEARRNSVIVDTAAAIAKVMATIPYPFWIVPAAITAAKGASQLITINQNRPKFAKGVLNLKGPGTETSDSIPAFLSKGESVMTAKETRRSMGILTAIRNNKLDDRILNKIDFSGGRSVNAVLNDQRIVEELKSIRSSQVKFEDQFGILYKVYTDSNGNKVRTRSKSI